MIYYKSKRIIDGKPRWIIVDETGKIVYRNPSKDELRDLEKEIQIPYSIGNKKYNDTNTCDRCGIEFKIAGGHPYKEYNNDMKWTGKWNCQKCHQKYDPNSTNNIKKSLAKRRIGDLKDPSKILGDNCEELTYRWLGAKKLSIENDCYNSPLDHSSITKHISVMIGDQLIDLYGKIPQTKGCFYNSYNQNWHQNFENELSQIARGFEFDIVILYCAIEDDIKIIDRVYIFTLEEILKRSGITVIKYNSIGQLYKYGWYEQYRVTNKEDIKIVNEIWKDITKLA